MANTVTLKLLADTKGIRDGIGQTNEQLGGLQNTLGKTTSFVKNMVTGFLALQAVRGAVAFVGDAIGAASDLNETVSKSNTIFGESAGTVNAWAKSAATNLGLSRSAALEAAAGFGNMYQQLGFSSQAAADMSTSTVQMAADLGSFNNLPTADVTDRISAAMRGEYDSLQTLIPNINAARVEAEAMAATGKTNADQLTAQEKATAVLAIVQKDGAAAMGDFAKTSDGLANKQKILQAKLEDVKAVIGNALLPIMSGLASFILDRVVPAAQQMASWFGDNVVPRLQELWATIQTNVLPILQSLGDYFTGTIVPALQNVATFIQQNSTLFTTLGIILGTLYAGFVAYNTAMGIWSALTKGYAAVQAAFNAVMAINPFVLIIIGLTALVAGLIYAWKNSETFRDVVTGVWNFIKGVVSGVLGWFTGTLWPGIQAVWNGIGNGLSALGSFFSGVWNGMVSFVSGIPGRITGFFSSIGSTIGGYFNSVKDGATNAFNGVVSFVSSIPGRILSALGNLGSLLLGAGADVIDGLKRGIENAIGKVKDVLGKVTGLIPDWKGPADVDKKLLVKNGQLIIGGFIRGLESQYGNVRASLAGLTSDIAGTPTPALAVAGAGSRGGNNYVIKVEVEAGADLEQFGMQVKKAIAAAEKAGAR